ncbi:MAG TPA: phosphoribosyltransferase [Patescibacteria group bacterium]|nr:phosphoribosyltransferase [Patescibacteria group bacterium]
MAERLGVPKEIPPYVPFLPHSKMIYLIYHNVFSYITPVDMDHYYSDLSQRNKLSDYDAVLVNLWGGRAPFHRLARLQGYSDHPFECEYHQAGGKTVEVPESLRDKKVLIVDDSVERGNTIKKIFGLVGPGSRAVVSVILRGVPMQVLDPRVDAAVLIDNVKVAGSGMDAGLLHERNFFREYEGVVVVPNEYQRIP